MFFQNPVFLYGLFSLAIPIIIHLFNFQRPQIVYFSNVNFIKQADENTKKGIALKHLLILLMRLLFLFFLVMAFARPIFSPNGSQSSSASAVAVYLDNSMSMQNQVSSGRAIESGLAFLSNLSDASPDGTKFRLTDNSFKYQDQYFISREKFKDRLTEVSYTYNGRDLKSVYQRQLLATNDDDQVRPNTVYWLSDFQKSTVGNLNSIVPDSTIQFKIIPIQNPAIANVFIDSVWLASPFIKPGEVNYLRAKVSNTGEKPVSGLSITCYTDDKTSGSASVDISPKGSTQVDFGFPASSTGEMRIKLAFEEQPVSFDNQFFAIIHPVAKIKVALISNGNDSYVKKVFDGEDAFILNTFTHRNIDYNTVEKAGLVLVEDAEKLEGNVLKFLSGYVKSGGHLVLIPGDTPQPEKLALISKELSTGSLAYQTEESKTSLTIPDKQQPFFAGIFEDIKSDMSMPEVQNTWKWSNWEEDLLVDKNKVAYLSTRKSGKGEIYVFGSPMNKKFSSFPSHSLFVPVMYKLAIRSQRNQENLAYRIGQSNIQLKLAGASPTTLYTLSNSHLSLIPDQKISGDVITMTLPKENLVPGYYTLSTPGFAAISIALNSDRNESDMSTYSTDELKSIFGKYSNVEILPISANNTMSNVSAASLGTGDLWKFCIILSLIFLLAEILLIRFFK